MVDTKHTKSNTTVDPKHTKSYTTVDPKHTKSNTTVDPNTQNLTLQLDLSCSLSPKCLILVTLIYLLIPFTISITMSAKVKLHRLATLCHMHSLTLGSENRILLQETIKIMKN